ncbi:acyltransferase [Streptomyces poriferorum]|uniref:acyltransferase family protein n=1 Tax=Streptomyces poriferorum TaxID=2798799 RepID=UPI001F38BE3A|nr:MULTISPECIES: acyltransferase [Streptomyces]WLQ48630.1 acyltransferase [Streptomyces sp. Alt1]
MTHPSQPSVYPQQPPEPHTVPFPVQPQAWTQLPGQEEWARPAGPAPWTQAPVPVPPAPEPEAAPPAAAAPGRDRYLDLLRAVALVRVVVFHLFGWAWLTIVFPSMGVMFALAGSLMARSLARPAWSVVRSRLRRLLPPMWAFLAVVVPMVFLLGWKPVREEGIWWFLKLGCYLLPVGTPPFPWESGSEGGFLETSWAEQAMGPLWYIRAYLWFVLASPLLLKAFRRLPWVTLLAPVGLTAVIGTGLVTVPGTAGEGLVDFAVFGSCWILGFAHNDGLLRTVPRYLTVSMATFLMAFALWWASGHLTEEGWNLDEIPLAQATWSLGFCVILLQYAPSWRQLPGRLAGWDGLVTLANNRAVTIYLWHNLLLMAGFLLIDQLWNVPWVGDHLGTYIDASGNALELIVIWPLIGLMILAFGWVEDVAAKRRPRLWPNGQSRKAGAGSRGAAVPGGTRRR